MASKQSDSIKKLYGYWLEELGANPDMSLDELRGMFEHWGDITAEPTGIDYLEDECGGVPCMWAIPKACEQSRVLLCTHGGGYVCGSMYTHRKVFGHIAKAVGCRALIVHYRRAPEHPHPVPVNDCVAVYESLLEQGVETEHIATVGDSAGGALSTTVILGAREKDLPLPAAAMPMSPWYDQEIKGDSIKTNAASDCLVKEEIITNMSETFLGGASKTDPLANPLYADLRGLPPMYLQVGGAETLLDDTLRFEKLAKDAGVEVKVDVFPDMQHVFQFMAGVAPEADEAVRRLAQWVRPKLGLG